MQKMAKNQWRLTGGSRYEEEQHQGRLVRCRHDLPHSSLSAAAAVSVEMREMERWRLPESSFHYLEIIQFVCRFTEGSLFCRSFVICDPDRTYFWTRGFPQQHVRWCTNIPWMFMLHIILDGNVSVKLAKYFWLALILPAEFNSSVWEQQRLSKYLLKHPWRHIFAPWG